MDVTSLQNELDTVKNNLDILTVEFQSIKFENETLKEKIRHSIDSSFYLENKKSNQEYTLNSELDSKILENAALQSQLLQMKQIIKQNQELQDELDVLKSKLTEMEEVKQWNQLLQTKLNEEKDLKKQLKQLETQFETTVKKNNQLESTITKSNSFNHYNTTTLNVLQQQWNREKVEWTRQLKQKEQIIQSNGVLILKLQSEIESLTLKSAQCTRHEQQIKQLQEEMKQLQEKYKQRERVLINKCKQMYYREENRLNTKEESATSLHWKHQFQRKCLEVESLKEVITKRSKEWNDRVEWTELQKREEDRYIYSSFYKIGTFLLGQYSSINNNHSTIPSSTPLMNPSSTSTAPTTLKI